jgi:hypothetical protein
MPLGRGGQFDQHRARARSRPSRVTAGY